jgi:hypothetical protein
MLEQFLERLEKVRKSGKGYAACCPVHKDRNPSMTITEKDGKVLCYCFSCGANGQQVAEAIGLPNAALFSEPFIKTGMSRKDREDLEMDRLVLMIAEKNEPSTYADFKRLRLAKERVVKLEELERQSLEQNNLKAV